MTRATREAATAFVDKSGTGKGRYVRDSKPMSTHGENNNHVQNENQAISLFYLFFETSLALSSSLPRVVTSSLKSSKLSRSCQNRILYQFYYMSCYALCLGNTADAWSHRAGSLSAIYNVHLGRHSDIPKLFRPPLSRHVPHILCLLLTLQRLCQRIPQPCLSFQVCFAPPSHHQNAFLFLSQHSPPHSRHLPGQAA